jgi:hypothetical protein
LEVETPRPTAHNRANLQRVRGEALCSLIVAHYEDRESRQAVVPLKLTYLPGDA